MVGVLQTQLWVLCWLGSCELLLWANFCSHWAAHEYQLWLWCICSSVNLELVRAKFDSQSAAPGSNPKSQRKPQLKRPIFAQFLANATCFFKEGGGFPQISARILSKVCKSLPNPSQTWAEIQKYSENRFFFSGAFAAGSGQHKKE